jgi:acyl carrier protein
VGIDAERLALRDQLRGLILEFAPERAAALADDTPLITSGLMESLTLLNVALWVETKVGSEVEITSFDLATEWDSVSDILTFIERHRASPGA